MPHPHPAVITTPPPSSHPERGRISLGNFWSSCGWPEVTQQGTGLDLSSPTAPAPGVLDLGVNWLDTSSFLELWFGQAEGRKGSVALCRCSGPGTIRAGSKERGLLARGHGDPGLRSSCAWPMEEDPSFLGILFCVQDPDMGASPFWSLVAPPRGQDSAGHPTGPLPQDPWPKYQQGRSDLCLQECSGSQGPSGWALGPWETVVGGRVCRCLGSPLPLGPGWASHGPPSSV